MAKPRLSTAAPTRKRMPKETAVEAPAQAPDPMAAQVRVMIEETAYYLAERRGFSPGYELEDWLQAEKQVLERLRDGADGGE
jgi:hypothetical protein